MFDYDKLVQENVIVKCESEKEFELLMNWCLGKFEDTHIIDILNNGFLENKFLKFYKSKSINYLQRAFYNEYDREFSCKDFIKKNSLEYIFDVKKISAFNTGIKCNEEQFNIMLNWARNIFGEYGVNHILKKGFDKNKYLHFFLDMILIRYEFKQANNFVINFEDIVLYKPTIFSEKKKKKKIKIISFDDDKKIKNNDVENNIIELYRNNKEFKQIVEILVKRF